MHHLKLIENLTEQEQGIFKVVSIRPKRHTVIQQDDIINLKIALETCRTLEEFLHLV